MFFSPEPPSTGFEFRWSMLGVHVRVFPSFFIFSAILIGLLVYVQLPQIDLATLAFIVAVDVACVFVAFLFVGMVQGLVYRSYGLRTTLVLREFFPGLYPEAEPPTAIQRIVVALANPASAFILYAAVYYSNHEFGWQKENVVLQLSYFILSSLALLWGVIGLLPIFPYSGGRVLLELLQVVSKRNGLLWTLLISIAASAAYIAYTAAVYFRHMKRVELVDGLMLPAHPLIAIFFGLSLLQNWQILQMILAQRREPRVREQDDDDYDDRRPWER